MSNEIFDALLREKVDVFKAAFSTVSSEVFYNQETKMLRHAGEYGMYREAIVRDFLKFIIPGSLDMSTGFLISSMNDVSTQCDIVVFDSGMTPLYQEGDRQRFFPVESVFCVGEVKSTLSRVQFSEAINKLAAIKSLGERITHPTIIRKSPQGPFDPINHAYDLFPTILICQKLDFKLDEIERQMDEMYDSSIEHRHKHNLILSIEDGLISYYDQNQMNLPYPRLHSKDLKHRFTWPGINSYVHFKLFASYMFMLTANKTLLYPEVSDYMGTIEGGYKRDQA
jgi:hypothetical protein